MPGPVLDEVLRYEKKSLFGNVVAIAFQIAFYTRMHANDIFLFLKNYF